MSEKSYLTNQLLIAMPSLRDPNFFHTVTYICEHSSEGAMGIVINRPLGIRLGEVMEHLDIGAVPEDVARRIVFQGGPVQTERGFVIHRPLGHWDSTLAVTEDIGITTSRDVLAAIAQCEGPEKCIVALGYAGWAAGQLEQELSENAWLSGPAVPDILFDRPIEQRWEASAALIGVNLNLLSGDVGHA
jgi:putative transcriptional regulator